jgi:hypothetical protein
MATGLYSRLAHLEVQRMRSLRLNVLGLAALAAAGLTPAGAAAQEKAASWQDSWFWGAYGGYTSFATSVAHTNAPTIGADWVITRSRYALNVFAEQSYFNAVSTVVDFPTTAPRRVDITDMRRVGFAAMIFTPSYKLLKPYVGLGYALNFIKTGTPEGAAYASPAARDSVLLRVRNARAAGKPFGDFGLMLVWRRFAPFAQYTVMPTQGTGNWFVNGQGFTNIWSAGLRYNFGTSIEKNW